MEVKSGLNKTQLEILQMFSSNLTDEELLELKRTFVQFLVKKANHLANQFWDEKGWTNEDMERLSKEHFRTPYKNKGELF